MKAAIYWVMIVRFFAGEPLEVYGPFTGEAECTKCVRELDALRPALAKRTGRALGPGYMCFSEDETPDDLVTLPGDLHRSPCGE